MFEDISNPASWLNYRRKRFWLALVLVLYTIAGFFVLPWALTRLAPDLAFDYTQRDLEVGQVAFNPYSLRLEVNDLKLLDDAPVNPDEPNLITVDTLVVNVAFTRLLRLTLGFDEVSIVRPQIFLARYAFADSNWGRMLNDIEAAESAQAGAETTVDSTTETDDSLPLFIAQLVIDEGALTLEDELTEKTFNTRIEPISIAVNNLSTLDNVAGAQSITLITERGVTITWSGSLELNPLISQGNLSLSGSPLPTIYRYFEDDVAFNLDNCCLDIELDYDVEALPSGDVSVAVSNASLLLQNFDLDMRDTGEPLLRLPALRIEGGELAWPEQTARVRLISVDDPEVYAWLNEDGSLNTDTLVKTTAPAAAAGEPDAAAATSETDTGTDEEGTDWSFLIDEARIVNLRAGFTDKSLPEPGRIEVQTLNFSLRRISSEPNSRWPVQLDTELASGGQLAVSGGVIAAPDVLADGRIELQALQLNALQPWLADAAQVKLQQGVLDVDVDFESNPQETLRAVGMLAITGLDMSDTSKDESLVGWQALKLSDIDLQLDEGFVGINRIQLDKPFARLNIAADGSTNFDSLANEEADAAAATPDESPDSAASGENEFVVKVGSTVVDDGSVDFSDESLPLPFRVMIEEFGGTVSAVDSTSTQPSQLDFKGKVGEFGATTLQGDVSLLAPDTQTDVQLDFTNISMPTLSPYTAEFVGRAIESGKLDLALDYQLENRVIDGANNMVLRDFRLGEKVPSEDAMNLPLDLALALLTDANGVIDLDVKVHGEMDDPGFSASGVVLKAFANVITKAATAPFKLLGNLVPGGKDVDLDAIEFAPGEAELDPPQREKLLTVTTALRERPALQLQLNGGFASEADAQALRAANLQNQLNTVLGRPDPSARQTRKALEKLAKQQLPELSLGELRETFNVADAATGKLAFDELAYSAELRRQLEERQPVTNQALQTLGRQRRDIMAAFLSAPTDSGGLADEIVVGDVTPVDLDDRGRVRVPLQVVPAPQ